MAGNQYEKPRILSGNYTQLTLVNGLFDTRFKYLILNKQYQILYGKYEVLYHTYSISTSKYHIATFQTSDISKKCSAKKGITCIFWRGTEISKNVIHNIEYCIHNDYNWLVYPIGINIFPIGYSLLATFNCRLGIHLEVFWECCFGVLLLCGLLWSAQDDWKTTVEMAGNQYEKPRILSGNYTQLTLVNGLFDTRFKYLILNKQYQILYGKYEVLYHTYSISTSKYHIATFQTSDIS